MSFSAGEIMFGWSVGGATEPLAHVSCNFGLSTDASDELEVHHSVSNRIDIVQHQGNR